jgi:hypothetical protein
LTDGDLHGLCNVDSDCVDDNVECKNKTCKCIDGYRDIDGICQQGISQFSDFSYETWN